MVIVVIPAMCLYWNDRCDKYRKMQDMTTLNMVDREQRDLIAGLQPFDRTRDGVEGFRNTMADGLGPLLTPEPVVFGTESVPAGKDARPVMRVLVHRPDAGVTGGGDAEAPGARQVAGDARPAILYLHGGGMVAGTPEIMAGTNSRLAARTGAIVFAPAYRLAPEHPFPAGVEDCYAALEWLYDNAARLGVDPARISVMGDSGGGGLAAAVALMARDRARVALKAQILIYPMLDIRTGTSAALTDDPLTGEFMVNRDLVSFAWSLVKGDAQPQGRSAGYLSPALAEDLTGLAPAILVTGALDLFRDEDIAYACRLMASGVATDLMVHAGAVHGFDILPGEIAEQARTSLFAAMRRLI
jgi:acetyl esterase/lipase